MLHRGRITADGTEDDVRTGQSGVAGKEIWLELEVREAGSALRKAIEPLGMRLEGVQLLDDGIVRTRALAYRDVREEVSLAVIKAGLGLRALREASGLEEAFVKLSREGKSKPEEKKETTAKDAEADA